MSGDGEVLLRRTAELIDVPSVSRSEQQLASLVAAELGAIEGIEVVRIGDNVVARTGGVAPCRILLGGHLDTVPPAGNERSRREDGTLFGLGSADMKGGLAVLLALAKKAEVRSIETTYVFYAREEIARSESGLIEVEQANPDLLRADAAVMLEPTGAVIEAGCQGTLRAEVHLHGVRAHSARPWMGTNAIHRLAPVLSAISDFGDQRVVIDGCEFRESLQSVGVRGGEGGNVIPDEVTLVVNYRFAPDKNVAEATEIVAELLSGALDATTGEGIVVIDAGDGRARPNLEDPLLASLVSATGAPPRAKLAWTDVAFFAARGVPAANFGPGDPLLAHRADERVTAVELESVYSTLDAWLDRLGSATADA